MEFAHILLAALVQLVGLAPKVFDITVSPLSSSW